jgi:hypothetical protein
LALHSNTTASNNTAIGNSALLSNTTGTDNVSVGVNALYANTTADQNTAIGKAALATVSTSNNNTAVGFKALTDCTNVQNTAVGAQSMLGATTAFDNAALGMNSLSGVTTGDSNVGLGRSAGNNLTTGSRNVYIGKIGNASSSSVTDEILIGGDSATGKGANTGFIAPSGGVFQGNNSSSWSTTSDERTKKNISDNTVGLDKITQIRVRNFEYRSADEITDLPSHCAIKKDGVQVGVIAQEIQTILPDMVEVAGTGCLSLNTDNLTWYLVNAVKELKTELDAAKTRIATLEAG